MLKVYEMKKIGLLSDTHSCIDIRIFKYFAEVDEIWHAGDIGSPETADELSKFKPLKAVYGNIDGHELRAMFPKNLIFNCEAVKVFITHIGGYPGRYNSDVRQLLMQHKPKLFICGHSHILKVMPDRTLNLLHMNPGAAGNHGFHKVKTLLRFQIDGSKIENLEVIELGARGEPNVTDPQNG